MSRREPEHATNTRIDADSYAEEALARLRSVVRGLTERRRGYIRDEIAEAFDEGEHQGNCRAIRILSIARRTSSSPEVRAALIEVVQLLMNEAPEATR